MNKLKLLIDEIEQETSNMEVLNESVSKVPVAWHLHHTLSVLYNVLKILKKTDPKEFKKEFNFTKTILYLVGRLPRGKARTPKAVNKREEIKRKELEELLVLVKSLLKEIEQIPPKAFFKHPYFGMLDKKDSLKFLYLHTEHHMKIVREIINK